MGVARNTNSRRVLHISRIATTAGLLVIAVGLGVSIVVETNKRLRSNSATGDHLMSETSQDQYRKLCQKFQDNRNRQNDGLPVDQSIVFYRQLDYGTHGYLLTHVGIDAGADQYRLREQSDDLDVVDLFGCLSQANDAVTTGILCKDFKTGSSRSLMKAKYWLNIINAKSGELMYAHEVADQPVICPEPGRLSNGVDNNPDIDGGFDQTPVMVDLNATTINSLVGGR